MIKQGQVLSQDNLNRAFVSKTATGTQILLGSLSLVGITLSGAITAATFTGDGSALTNLNGTNIALGTVADARLSSNVNLLNATQTISGVKTFSATNSFTIEQRFYITTWTDPSSGVAKAIKFSGGMAGDTALFNGDVTIGDGTNVRRLIFTALGSTYAPPTGTAASNGSKVSFWGTGGGYNFGIDGSTLWYDTNTYHRFYTNVGTTTSTLRMEVNNNGVNIPNVLAVTGATNLTGTVTTTNDLIVGTNLDVRGQVLHGIQNEFPDPLVASGDVGLWTTGAGSIAFDSAQLPKGTTAYGSIKLTSTGAQWAQYGYYIDVNPGEWITFSCYAFSTTASNTGAMVLDWFDANKATASTAQSINNFGAIATGWTRYSVTGQAPANAAYFRVEVQNLTNTAITYFSAFQVERGRAVTLFKPYFGGGWTGSGVTNIPKIGGGVNILGYKPTTAYGAGAVNIYTDSDGTVANTYGRISAYNNYGIAFRYNSGEIYIGGNNPQAKVGIGTITPGYALDVVGDTKSSNQFLSARFNLGAATDYVNAAPWYGIGTTNLTLPGAGATAIQLAGYFGLNFQTQNGQMVMTSTGKVGIGTTGPTQTLTVVTSNQGGYTLASSPTDTYLPSGTVINVFGSGTSTNTSLINFEVNTTGGSDQQMFIGAISENTTANAPAAFVLGQRTGTSTWAERMRVNSSGNVGIGTTSPGQKLDVAGHISASAGNLHTNRNRLVFSSSATDSNHSIYNNFNNIDTEGAWDGMKMNVYNGLKIRTGNASGAVPTTIVSVDSTGVAITGTLNVTTFNPSVININSKFAMQYNATEDALDFVYTG